MDFWKDVLGWEDKYSVSRKGAVWSKINKRLLIPMNSTANHPMRRRTVRFSTDPVIDFPVSHLVLSHFVGARPEGAVAMHLDDQQDNNCVENLRWGTKRDNAHDMVMKGRGGNQMLGPDLVVEIYTRRTAGEKGRELAKEYGVSEQRVCDISNGRSAIIKIYLSEQTH